MSRNSLVISLVTAVSFALNGARIVGEWAVTWNGQLAGILLYVTPLLLLPAWWCCVIAILSSMAGLLSRIRQEALLTATCCVIFLATYYVCGYYSYMVRRSLYLEVAVTGTEVANAIAQFETERGYAPASLSDLVPRYITKIPTTGFVNSPSFEYHVYSGPGRAREPRWELIFHPSALPNQDELVYWPEAGYPASLPEGRIERLGRWAYIQEDL